MKRWHGVVLAAVAALGVAAAVIQARFRSDLAQAAARAAQGSQVLATRCGAIELQQAGEGQPLLMIHGSGGGHDQGMAFARALTQHGLHVIAVSRFGYLRTPRPADASPEAQADAHVCLLDALGIAQAVPFVISPTRVEGRLYIDGGIVNNFPVEPLFGLCDAILGVHATPLSARSEGELSSTFAVTQRALEIGMFHASRRKFHHADLVISPAGLGRFSTFDIKRHAEIVEVGYRATLEQLDAVRALL